jgi:hypothetical protein
MRERRDRFERKGILGGPRSVSDIGSTVSLLLLTLNAVVGNAVVKQSRVCKVCRLAMIRSTTRAPNRACLLSNVHKAFRHEVFGVQVGDYGERNCGVHRNLVVSYLLQLALDPARQTQCLAPDLGKICYCA